MVFGVPSPNRNEDLIACVVAEPAVTRAQLELHCRAGLSGWQVPRDFQLVSELPVDQRGKLSRAELARNYVEGQAQNPAGKNDARPRLP